MTAKDLNMDYSKYDFKDSTELYVYLSKKGLSKGTVEEISRMKGEPDWMRDFRLRSYEVFLSKPMPKWGGDLSKIDFQNIYYYTRIIAGNNTAHYPIFSPPEPLSSHYPEGY